MEMLEWHRISRALATAMDLIGKSHDRTLALSSMNCWKIVEFIKIIECMLEGILRCH